MISKDLLFLSLQSNEFKVYHITISIFSMIFYFSFKDIQIYFLDFELTQG